MWVFALTGFYSVVLNHDDPSSVMVRGRVEKDLERLQHIMSDLGLERGPISRSPDRDYPYRLVMPKSEWADAVYTLAKDIDYNNYKNQVRATDGHERAALYSRIWGIMLDAERTVER